VLGSAVGVERLGVLVGLVQGESRGVVEVLVGEEMEAPCLGLTFLRMTYEQLS
jgi:hypothetical protein